MAEEKDQQEETSEEETKEVETEEVETESEETETEPVTPEQALKLAQDLQKGYTITRQDMAKINENQQKIQDALDKLQKKDEFVDEDEPLTVKRFLEIQKQDAAASETRNKEINDRIEKDITELKIQGVVKDDKEADELLKYAVRHKITNLFNAAGQWEEVKRARQEGRKEGAKGKVKGEAGSQVGTSSKTKTGEKEEGFDYGEIAGKSMEELAEE